MQQLLDRQAIHDVLMRYARGIDRWDFEMVRNCYHPGATDDHGGFKGTVEGFIPWVKTQVDRFDSTMHFLGNILIDFGSAPEDPEGPRDVAWAETYCIAYHRLRGEDTDSIAGLRYVDRFENREVTDTSSSSTPEWRIAERKIVVEWNRIDSVKALGFGPDYLVGTRDHTDPSWDRNYPS